MLSNDVVLVSAFREDYFNTAKWSVYGRDTMTTFQLTGIRHLPVGRAVGSSKRQM